MKAVITVVGNDREGILALIATECAQSHINILDVSQTIVDGIFTMTMITNFDNLPTSLDEFAERMEEIGKKNSLIVRVMNHDIFKAMHSI